MARKRVEDHAGLRQRMRELRQALGCRNQRGFAARLGVKAETLGHWVAGERGGRSRPSWPAPESLRTMREACGLNPDWLTTGLGEMFIGETPRHLGELSRELENLVVQELVDAGHGTAEEVRGRLQGGEGLLTGLLNAAAETSDIRRRGDTRPLTTLVGAAPIVGVQRGGLALDSRPLRANPDFGRAREARHRDTSEVA